MSGSSAVKVDPDSCSFVDDHTGFNGLCVCSKFYMCVQCLSGKETHTDRFVLEIVFVLVIAAIMMGIIAEKEFEASLLARGEISDLLPLTACSYQSSSFLHFLKTR